jgi:hypothetical protein
VHPITDGGCGAYGELLDLAHTAMERLLRRAKYIERRATPENELRHTSMACLRTTIVVQTPKALAQTPDWASDAHTSLSRARLHDFAAIVEGGRLCADKRPEGNHAESTAFSHLLDDLRGSIGDRSEGQCLQQGSGKSPAKEASEERAVLVLGGIGRLSYLGFVSFRVEPPSVRRMPLHSPSDAPTPSPAPEGGEILAAGRGRALTAKSRNRPQALERLGVSDALKGTPCPPLTWSSTPARPRLWVAEHRGWSRWPVARSTRNDIEPLYLLRAYRDRGDIPLMSQGTRHMHRALLRWAGRVPKLFSAVPA